MVGARNGALGWSLSKVAIVRLQMGDAPVMPEATLLIGVLSLLPTQVAMRRLGV